MKKLNESEFGDTYSQRQMIIAHWEKLRAEGKWFWIFKRGAAWLASMLFLYGSGLLLFPNILHFEPFQFYILLGMFGGFMVSSLFEWTKMEAEYLEQKKIN